MAASLAQALWQVQRWTSSAQGADASDAALLERFIQRRDESAFAALVGRYGAMVLRQCRRVLGDAHEAEDAFQAVFLILARKAATIKRPDALPGWLYGVARRVALKARTKSASRAFAAIPLNEALADPRPDSLAQLSARELLDVLGEEVRQLPASQRSAVLLCCLEGLTQEEAARRLGVTAGSLKGHLERGRRRLHARLARRGIALAAALALAAVSRTAAEPLLLRSAVRAALDGVSGQAAALAESVLRGMFAFKLTAVAVAMTLTLAISATVALSYRGAAGEDPLEDKTPAAVKAAEKSAPSARVDAQGDPLPDGAILRIGSIRYRAGEPINHTALSSDGKLLATASVAGITLFDLATGKPRHLRESLVPSNFDTNGSKLAFSPDGKQLVNITNAGNLRFWDVATGKLLRQTGKHVVPPGGPIFPNLPSKMWFPADGNRVVTASFDHNVWFVDPSTGQTQRRFQVAGEPTSVASDGKTLVAIDAKRPEAILYDDRGKELRRFRHESKMDPAILCQGGKRLVTINEKWQIKVWDTATGEEQHTFALRAKRGVATIPMAVVSIAPDGNTLFVGTRDGPIHRWDLRTGKEQSALPGHNNFVTGLFFPPDGRSLFSVGWDHAIRRWDLTTGKDLLESKSYAGNIRVAHSPDGRIIALAASDPGCLEFWDAATGKRLRVHPLEANLCLELRFSPDGKHLAGGGSDGRVRLWETEKGSMVRELRIPSPNRPNSNGECWFEGLSWSPDGRFLATSVQDDGIRLWEAATGKEIWHKWRKGRIAFSPDGKTLVSGGWDHCLTFQDTATGDARLTLTNITDTVEGIAFAPDGSALATGHDSGNICLRDTKTGTVRKTLKGHQRAAWSASFSADSKWLVSGSLDHTVRIWEVATAAEVFSRKGHEGWVTQAEFGPDNRTVLSASHDLTALLWDIRPSSERGRKHPLEETLWADLAGEPAKAYRAIWELADDPKAASDLLRRKIAPVKLDLDERRVKTLLADLDSDDFAKREAAGRALAAMGEAVEGQLRRAVSEAKSAEVQRRVRGLLEGLKREPTVEDFRRMRAVQVMELCGTADVLDVLRDWAGGTADVPLTRQAQAALKRLTHGRQ